MRDLVFADKCLARAGFRSDEHIFVPANGGDSVLLERVQGELIFNRKALWHSATRLCGVHDVEKGRVCHLFDAFKGCEWRINFTWVGRVRHYMFAERGVSFTYGTYGSTGPFGFALERRDPLELGALYAGAAEGDI